MAFTTTLFEEVFEIPQNKYNSIYIDITEENENLKEIVWKFQRDFGTVEDNHIGDIDLAHITRTLLFLEKFVENSQKLGIVYKGEDAKIFMLLAFLLDHMIDFDLLPEDNTNLYEVIFELKPLKLNSQNTEENPEKEEQEKVIKKAILYFFKKFIDGELAHDDFLNPTN